jgi:hypothetical protein
MSVESGSNSSPGFGPNRIWKAPPRERSEVVSGFVRSVAALSNSRTPRALFRPVIARRTKRFLRSEPGEASLCLATTPSNSGGT